MRSNKGFTLIELVVAVGLMVITLTILATVFSMASGLYSLATQRSEVYNNMRAVFRILEQEIGNAQDYTLGQKIFIKRIAQFDAQGNHNRSQLKYVQYGQKVKDVADKNGTEIFLRYLTTTRWWDATNQRHTTQVAFVNYYLEERHPQDPFQKISDPDAPGSQVPNGFFLVRQIQPLDQNGAAMPFNDPKLPPKDYLCEYVNWVRIFYTDENNYDITEPVPFKEYTQPDEGMPYSFVIEMEVIDNRGRSFRRLCRWYNITAGIPY